MKLISILSMVFPMAFAHSYQLIPPVRQAHTFESVYRFKIPEPFGVASVKVKTAWDATARVERIESMSVEVAGEEMPLDAGIIHDIRHPVPSMTFARDDAGNPSRLEMSFPYGEVPEFEPWWLVKLVVLPLDAPCARVPRWVTFTIHKDLRMEMAKTSVEASSDWSVRFFVPKLNEGFLLHRGFHADAVCFAPLESGLSGSDTLKAFPGIEGVEPFERVFRSYLPKPFEVVTVRAKGEPRGLLEAVEVEVEGRPAVSLDLGRVPELGNSALSSVWFRHNDIDESGPLTLIDVIFHYGLLVRDPDVEWTMPFVGFTINDEGEHIWK